MKTEAQRNKERDNEALFNSVAHEYVRKTINIAEDKLLERQITNPVEIEEYLCRFYIEEVAGMIFGASSFSQADATLGAEIFIWKCLGGYTESPHSFRRRMTAPRLNACANQLSFHTQYYFPRYPAILTQRYLEELHKPDDEVLVAASWNGVFHLAAASLPGVREEVNRELRRRGLKYDAARVPVAHMQRRMRALASHGRLIGSA